MAGPKIGGMSESARHIILTIVMSAMTASIVSLVACGSAHTPTPLKPVYDCTQIEAAKQATFDTRVSECNKKPSINTDSCLYRTMQAYCKPLSSAVEETP